jgi:hypothetical protein
MSIETDMELDRLHALDLAPWVAPVPAIEEPRAAASTTETVTEAAWRELAHARGAYIEALRKRLRIVPVARRVFAAEQSLRQLGCSP